MLRALKHFELCQTIFDPKMIWVKSSARILSSCIRSIIALQVARMIMMGIEFTGKVPFSTVFLHGLVWHNTHLTPFNL